MKYAAGVLICTLVAVFSCGGDDTTGPSRVVSIEVTPATRSLGALGDTTRFTAVARDAAGNTIAGKAFTWSSGNPLVATVDRLSGLVTAVANGTAAIMATADGVQGSGTLAVAQVVATVEVSPANDTLTALDDTLRLTASALDARSNPIGNESLAWSSTAPSVATVSTTGLVTAVGNGTTTVAATARSVQGTARIVVSQTVAAVTVTPSADTLTALGDTSRLSAVAVDANGNIVSGKVFTWNSSAPSVATVDGTGLVTAVDNGTATIGASVDGFQGAAEVTVAQEYASLTVTPRNASLVPGETVQLIVTTRDAYGNVVPNPPLLWSVSDPTTLDVDASGLVTVAGIASPGASENVSVNFDSLSDTASIVVLLKANAIGGGYEHTCAVTEAGAASCWGDNDFGQLGDGSTMLQRLYPEPVAGSLTFHPLSAPGFGHTCSVTLEGDAYCWGWNVWGQLGDGSTTDSNTPVAVSGDLKFTPVLHSGNTFTCGIVRSGETFCWGGGGGPVESRTPVLAPGGRTFFALAAGGGHACGIEPGGAAHCWARPNDIRAVPGGHAFRMLSGGDIHTCGVTSAGDAYCWGDNRYGQLGDSSTVNRADPVLVYGGLTYASVSTKDMHTCGITQAGKAYCWGYNFYGQLGDNTTTNRLIPVPVYGDLTFSTLTTGGDHTCGITTAGEAYCWGRNASGQLGDGTTDNRLTPTLVQQWP